MQDKTIHKLATKPRLTVTELAEYAGVNASVVHYWLKNDKLSHFVSCGVRYVSLDMANAFLKLKNINAKKI